VLKALGDFLVLKILRESSGIAVEVTDEEIAAMMRLAGVSEGMLLCPEGAAALEGARQLAKQGFIDPHEDVLVINTGSGLKYGESLQGSAPIRLEKGASLPRVERLLAG